MIGSVYSSQSLSSVAPVLTNGLMNKVAMMAGMEVLHGLSDMDSHTPRMIWLQSLLRAQSSRSRNQPWNPNMAPFPGMISQLPSGGLITLDHFPHGKSVLCSCWNRYLLWIQIHLPWTQCFSQNYHPSTYRMPYPPLQYSIQHCLWTRNSLYSKRSIAVGPYLRNSVVLLCPPLSWNNWLDWKVGWPFEDSVTVPDR